MKNLHGTEWPETLNLNELAARHDLTIVIKPRTTSLEVEIDCKIRQESAQHALRKDWWLFRIGVCASAVFAVFCIGLVLTAELGSDRNWALATLTAMITGMLGYLSGRR